jgi:hypothetical protein
MKKNYLTLLLFVLGVIQSKGQFFEYTKYKGAFDLFSKPGSDWTAGWVNWDPEETNYPATNLTVSSDITVNTTWSTGQVVLLKNKVYVTNGATLTIQPGVVVRGDKATEGTLIISRGSKIMAQGTATNPIVFTSNFDVVDGRSPGDWGGVVLLGAATINTGSSVVEGGLDPLKANFGGNNDADNSGIFSFVRIEFAGFPFQPDKEINGLTLGGVGSSTKIDHVQVSFSNDDSFEWFGGSVNAKYLIAYRGVDDDFDTDNGYRGKLQFILGIKDPLLADQCTCSTSEGFESDNDASGSTANPITEAVFSNVTLIGPYRGSTSNFIDSKFKRAVRIRRNSSISLFNSIFCDWPTGLHIDGSASEANASSQAMAFQGNALAGMGTNLQVNTGSTFDINNYFTANQNSSFSNSGSIPFVNPYPGNWANPDYRLSTLNAADTGTVFTNPKLGSVINNTVENNESLVSAELWPNPVINRTTLSLNVTKSVDVIIKIFDLSGRCINNETFSLNSGENRLAINADGFAPGVYLIVIHSEMLKHHIKMIVSK